MRFEFTRNNLPERERRLERALEILPGALSWGILAGMCVLAFVKPLAAAVIIIAFDLYWILRLFYMNIFLVLSYIRLAVERGVNWQERIRDVDCLSGAGTGTCPSGEPGPQTIRARLLRRSSESLHRRRLRELAASGKLPPASDTLYHLVIFPVSKEGREIVEGSIQGLARGSFPPKMMMVVVALEESATARVKEAMRSLESAYQGTFLELRVVEHPSGSAGEARVKGANASHAARHAAGWFLSRGVPLENVIVSCFDADTVASEDYFFCLLYNFLITPDRLRVSFQPIPVYHNNLWEAPGFARVLDVGSSFFQMIEATNPDTLVTFSSHSMSFKTLVDVGYWPADMISDDSAIFWKSFLHYDGDYRVVPLYTTLSMDIAMAGNWWKTFMNVYKQRRRWAWGVENFPLLMRGFLRSRTIPFFTKLSHAYKMLEGHVAWATWPFLLTIIGWLPALFAGREFTHTTMYYSAPRVTMTIFRLASFGLLTCIIVSIFLLPRTKTRFGFMLKILHALEWLLVPLVSVILNAVPALDAQTRLMRGKYMEFHVTDKKRKKR